MATKPKPKPKPEPEPDEDEAARMVRDWPQKLENIDAAASIAATNMMALDDRVTALEFRLDKLEADAKEPPIRLGRRA